MIYLFTGDNEYLVRSKVKAWKKLFTQKHGDFNLVHIKSVNDFDKNFIGENLLAEAFLGAKKLVIIDDIPAPASLKETKVSDIQDFFLTILDKVPESNIVLFASAKPDKRSKFYKELIKIAKIEQFSSPSDIDIKNKIRELYKNQIDSDAIDILISYKAGDFYKIVSEIEKLLITIDKITKKDIEKFIYPELEESIFRIIDDILNMESIQAIKKIKITNQATNNIYLLYNSLIANLRTMMYIMLAKRLKLSNDIISNKLNLGTKSFLISKSYKIDFITLKELYIDLANIDKRMKSGELMGTNDEDLLYEVEMCIIKTR